MSKTDENQKPEVAVQRLVRGIRKLSKIGTGPCGGGGMLGEYHEGVRATQRRVREECRKLLKEYSDANRIVIQPTQNK